MSKRFVNTDRKTPFLFPPSVQDWVEENDLCRFIVECIEQLNLDSFSVNHKGTGSDQYNPAMMLALLVYCYSNGIFSSRKIEKATYNLIPVRYICANTHPDHDTICTFRKVNDKAIKECFVKILQLAKELGFLKIGNVAIDGTKLKANASKHKAVSYKRAKEMIACYQKEVDELMQKAENADNNSSDKDLDIPKEIELRETRIEKLKHACKVIEERAKEKASVDIEEYHKKVEKREEQRKSGKKPRGKDPSRPKETPEDKDQYNFTDPESRIMKAGNGKNFQQSYNCQNVVDTNGSMLILGNKVTDCCNDKNQLNEALDSVPQELGDIDKAATDNGFYCEAEIIKAENNNDRNPNLKVYASLGKSSHHKSIEELSKKYEEPDNTDKVTKGKCEEIMSERLNSKDGHDFYKLRKETVEPVFGIIKNVIGFREFLVRGIEKVQTEWDLVCLSYNFKRLHKLKYAK